MRRPLGISLGVDWRRVDERLRTTDLRQWPPGHTRDTRRRGCGRQSRRAMMYRLGEHDSCLILIAFDASRKKKFLERAFISREPSSSLIHEPGRGSLTALGRGQSGRMGATTARDYARRRNRVDALVL